MVDFRNRQDSYHSYLRNGSNLRGVSTVAISALDYENYSDSPPVRRLRRLITDPEGLTDAVQRRVLRLITDSEGLTDSAQRIIGRRFVDSEGLTDLTINTLARIVTDSEGATDSSTTAQIRHLLDSEGLTDSLLHRDLFRSLIDGSGLSDHLATTLKRFLADSEALTDSILVALFQLGCAVIVAETSPVCIRIAPPTVDLVILTPLVTIAIIDCD